MAPIPEHVDVTTTDAIARVALAKPPVNALDLELLGELRTALEDLREDDGVHGVLLTSDLEGHFSAGLDLPRISAYDEDELAAFADRFLGLFEDMYGYPKPLVAAVPGHCIAGGLLLAATADHRVAAAGEFELVMREVDLGLPMPTPEAQVIRELVGFRTAREVLLHGETYRPKEAERIGLVDDVVPPGDVEDAALALLEPLAEKPLEGFAGIKRSARDPLLRHMRDHGDEAREDALAYFD